MEILGLDPRRLGSALLVFGAVGVALAVVGAVALLSSAIATASLDADLEGSRVQLVASLQRAELALGAAGDTTDHVGATLDSTRSVLSDSSRTLGTLGDASDSLASALGAVSLLGSQPFASAATDFRSLATQVRAYADHATQLSSGLTQNVSDMRTITSDLRDLQGRLGQVSTSLDALQAGTILTTLLVGLVLLLALTVWLAIGALACAIVGYRIRLRAVEPIVVEARAVIIPDRAATEVVEIAAPSEGRPRRPDDRTE
ncbi:MAG TPA: hypothetical protein VEY67_02160 [Candidatus Dormibacteraeota bacterium]|nr:hypothetical protein [Candidatus Dormibacteraeota bacterium]